MRHIAACLILAVSDDPSSAVHQYGSDGVPDAAMALTAALLCSAPAARRGDNWTALVNGVMVRAGGLLYLSAEQALPKPNSRPCTPRHETVLLTQSSQPRTFGGVALPFPLPELACLFTATSLLCLVGNPFRHAAHRAGDGLGRWRPWQGCPHRWRRHKLPESRCPESRRQTGGSGGAGGACTGVAEAGGVRLGEELRAVTGGAWQRKAGRRRCGVRANPKSRCPLGARPVPFSPSASRNECHERVPAI